MKCLHTYVKETTALNAGIMDTDLYMHANILSHTTKRTHYWPRLVLEKAALSADGTDTDVYMHTTCTHIQQNCHNTDQGACTQVLEKAALSAGITDIDSRLPRSIMWVNPGEVKFTQYAVGEMPEQKCLVYSSSGTRLRIYIYIYIYIYKHTHT